MGLTIHYSLQSDVATAADARNVIECLRMRATELPFSEVGKIIERTGGDECDHEQVEHDDPLRWLLVQAAQPIRYTRNRQEYWAPAAPTDLFAFAVDPGDGCEPANFGLCRYPKRIVASGRAITTKLSGWCWSSFCKTQYASNPSCGGVKNFLRCHVGLVQVLDQAKELGVLASVNDEGKYWDRRDLAALIREIGEWNQMIAGFYGGMKDASTAAGHDPRALMAEIAKFPNFEHLEARNRT
jgi:hypothetical protein